jgi:hypothetical protein
MSDPLPLSEGDEADLAALADGRLDPQKRHELEARAASEPALARAIERQRAGLAAITRAADGVSAPVALRAQVERMQAEAAAPRRRRRLLAGRWPALGLAAAAAAAAVLAVVVLGGGGAPSTGQVLAAALRPPLAAASLDRSQPRLLREQVDGTRFPNYAAKFGWEAAGTRTDEIDGRETRTVFYRRGGERIAYTIVAGEKLPWPEGAAKRRYEGVELRSFAQAGRTAVTWRRQGHTCMLSGAGVPAATLVELAAWKGQGAVTF